jgi:hypothetical protein
MLTEDKALTTIELQVICIVHIKVLRTPILPLTRMFTWVTEMMARKTGSQMINPMYSTTMVFSIWQAHSSSV